MATVVQCTDPSCRTLQTIDDGSTTPTACPACGAAMSAVAGPENVTLAPVAMLAPEQSEEAAGYAVVVGDDEVVQAIEESPTAPRAAKPDRRRRNKRATQGAAPHGPKLFVFGREMTVGFLLRLGVLLFVVVGGTVLIFRLAGSIVNDSSGGGFVKPGEDPVVDLGPAGRAAARRQQQDRLDEEWEKHRQEVAAGRSVPMTREEFEREQLPPELRSPDGPLPPKRVDTLEEGFAAISEGMREDIVRVILTRFKIVTTTSISERIGIGGRSFGVEGTIAWYVAGEDELPTDAVRVTFKQGLVTKKERLTGDEAKALVKGLQKPKMEKKDEEP